MNDVAIAERKTMNGKPVFFVPSGTVVNFDSRFDKKLLCDGITFTAGSACVYDCSFCYVPDMQRKQRAWMEKNGVIYGATGHSSVVIRNDDFFRIGVNQIMGKPEAFRQQKLTIYGSPKVDVAGNMELLHETADLVVFIIMNTNWDVRLLSKSNLLPKLAEILSRRRSETRERVIYGVSTGTLDDKLAAAFEKGCPLVRQRIKSLHWLQDNGYRTFGMVCPSLPMPGEASAAEGKYLQFSADMMKAIRWEKCEHVWAEVINVRDESFTRTIGALSAAGYDDICAALSIVSHDKAAWEHYARATFMAHTAVVTGDKLRFLQYVTKDTRSWWESRVKQGAVIL